MGFPILKAVVRVGSVPSAALRERRLPAIDWRRRPLHPRLAWHDWDRYSNMEAYIAS